MAEYTLVNLTSLDDAAPGFGLGDVQEARFATGPLGCTQTGLAFLRLKPGMRQPFAHHHSLQEELYVVLAGSGNAKLNEELRELRAMDVVRVAPHVTRAFEAGPDGLELLAFGAPAVSAGENDAVMVEGFWPEA